MAREVIGKLQEVVGPDALLSAYNAARTSIGAQRTKRKTHQKLQTMLDPEAAARMRHRKQERKAVGRKRKQDDFQRRRSAGLPVKNKRRTAKGAE